MESIKNFLKRAYEILYYKIEDSVFYNILVEKYENLDLHYQKWIHKGFLIFGGLMIILIPLSFFFASIQKTEEFQFKKTLVNQMIQTPSSVREISPLNAVQWNEKINQVISQLSLSNDQNVKISPHRPSLSQIPKSLKDLTHIGKKIQIEGLNIQEVVDIGYALDQMDSSVKLIQLQVQQTPLLTHYFKATYFVFLFFNPDSRNSFNK